MTLPDLARPGAVYRLSGDRNPLHSDPSFAAMGGFDTPILHGLCTYGFTGRALLHALCDGDPARFKSMEGRFSSPVFPGDDLTIEIWVDGDGEAVYKTKRSGLRRRDTTSSSIDQGACTFREQPEVLRAHPAQHLVVDLDALDPAVAREHAGLRRDRLRDEHAAHRPQRGIALEPCDVASELLDAVDLASALHLDGHGRAVAVAAQEVDGPDVGRVLAPHEHEVLRDRVGSGREQRLQLGLDAVLLEARIRPELVGGVREHLLEADDEPLALGVRDRPGVTPSSAVASTSTFGATIQFRGL